MISRRLVSSCMVVSLSGLAVRQNHFSECSPVRMIIQTYATAEAIDGGVGEEETDPQTLALGGNEGIAQLIGDLHADAGAMVTNVDYHLALIPVQADEDLVRRGVGGIVEQVGDGLIEGGVHLKPGGPPLVLHFQVVTDIGP